MHDIEILTKAIEQLGEHVSYLEADIRALQHDVNELLKIHSFNGEQQERTGTRRKYRQPELK